MPAQLYQATVPIGVTYDKNKPTSPFVPYFVDAVAASGALSMTGETVPTQILGYTGVILHVALWVGSLLLSLIAMMRLDADAHASTYAYSMYGLIGEITAFACLAVAWIYHIGSSGSGGTGVAPRSLAPWLSALLYGGLQLSALLDVVTIVTSDGESWHFGLNATHTAAIAQAGADVVPAPVSVNEHDEITTFRNLVAGGLACKCVILAYLSANDRFAVGAK